MKVVNAFGIYVVVFFEDQATQRTVVKQLDLGTVLPLFNNPKVHIVKMLRNLFFACLWKFNKKYGKEQSDYMKEKTRKD